MASCDECLLDAPLPPDFATFFFGDEAFAAVFPPDFPLPVAAVGLPAALPEAAFFGAGLAGGGSGGCGLMVIGLPTFGLTTKGFGPGFEPGTGFPSAVRFGPDPGGGMGVFPAGRAAA